MPKVYLATTHNGDQDFLEIHGAYRKKPDAVAGAKKGLSEVLAQDYAGDFVTEVREESIKDGTVSHVLILMYTIQVGDLVVGVFSNLEDARKALAKDSQIPISKVPDTLEKIEKARIEPPEGEADLYIKKLELV
jgi:hypothetical protein